MSYRGQRVTVYFPCRNEANHLKHVVDEVPDFVDELLIISNRSTDDTMEKAQELGLRAIEDNRATNGIGYGYAHITGLAAATGDLIATADADLTYPIAELARVLDHLLDHDLDVLSCNRYPVQEGAEIPWKLQLGVRVLNLEVRTLLRHRVHDILSGMWVVRKDVVPKLRLTMGDWNMSPQIKIAALRDPDVRFGETGIAQHQRAGSSHQQYLRTGLSHAKYIYDEWRGKHPATTPDAT